MFGGVRNPDAHRRRRRRWLWRRRPQPLLGLIRQPGSGRLTRDARTFICRIPATGRNEMKILIVAPENDNHTAPLKWALERAGFGVACWAGLGFAEKRQASISLSSGHRVQLGVHIVEPGDVVWVRRPDPPRLNPRSAP